MRLERIEQAYKTLSEEIRKSLNPNTPLEIQFAQTVADCQWRLNRIRSIEDAMLGLAHDEAAGNFSADHPSIHSAFTAAKTFRENSQAFVNLSIYEQRITRHQKEALRQLKDLQAERKAQEKQALEEAILLRKAHEIKALPFDPGLHQSAHGFVFSTAEIDREIHRRSLLEIASGPARQPQKLAPTPNPKTKAA